VVAGQLDRLSSILHGAAASVRTPDFETAEGGAIAAAKAEALVARSWVVGRQYIESLESAMKMPFFPVWPLRGEWLRYMVHTSQGTGWGTRTKGHQPAPPRSCR
jgi:hypothetical protein